MRFVSEVFIYFLLVLFGLPLDRTHPTSFPPPLRGPTSDGLLYIRGHGLST